MSKNRIQLELFDFTKLVVGSTKVNTVGSKSAQIYYNEKPLEIQTPRLLSFGLNKWGTNDDIYYSTTFSFLGLDNDPKIKSFYDFLKGLDEWGKQMALEHSWEWLGTKQIEKETIDTIYHTTLKEPKPPGYVRFKIKKSSSGISTLFFNKEKTEIPKDEIETLFTKGSYIRALIKCNGFWISNGKLGISWKVDQIVIEPRVIEPRVIEPQAVEAKIDNTIYAFQD